MPPPASQPAYRCSFSQGRVRKASFSSYVELRSVEIGSPKTAVEFLASPVAVFRLYEPIFVDISFRAFPRAYAAGQIECGFEAEGIFHTGIQRTVGGGKQVAFDSRFLCGNGKGAAEQKTRKDIPVFHVLLYIGLVGFKEYFQVIGGFFRAFGFGGFQQADAFVGVVAQQLVGSTAVLIGKRFAEAICR